MSAEEARQSSNSLSAPISTASSLNFQSVVQALTESELIQTIYQNAPSRQEVSGFADSTRQDLFNAADATRRNLSNVYDELQLSPAFAETLDSIYRPFYGAIATVLLTRNPETIYPRVEPLLTSISSPETQKRIINRIVFGSIFLILFLGGLSLYSIFYSLYVPVLERGLDIYMDHGNPNSIFSTVDLISANPPEARVHHQITTNNLL